MNARDLIPTISRARDYHVYTGNSRYLDFWQDDGRAILGHRGVGARAELKRRLDRGLLAPYPTPISGQLSRSLSRLLPGRSAFRWYSDAGKAAQAISHYLGIASYDLRLVADPATGKTSDGCMIWRPFLEEASALANVVLPILPFPGAGWLIFLAFRDPIDSETDPSDPVSPAYLAAIKRSIFDLISYRARATVTDWTYFDIPIFRRRGPYLELLCEESGFRSLYRAALDLGIMLAPEFGAPSIVPGSYGVGEVQQMNRLR